MTVRRIAVLVDGDNVSPKNADEIYAKATTLGRIDIARVYLDASRPTDWSLKSQFRLIHAGVGKNAADVLLCIDALELALVHEVDSFVLASSDGDFSHLAHRLRERGLHVLGMGEPKAPGGFRLACSKFEVLQCDKPATYAPPTRLGPDKPTAFDQNIKSVIAAHSTQGQGIRVVDLAPRMSVKFGTRISRLPEKTWRSYLSKRPALFDLDARGPDAKVRYKMDGFASH